MSKYSNIALNSVRDLIKNAKLSPNDAWDQNAKLFYPKQLSSQTKSCPKSTFLSLCEQGIVKGVKAGSYTKSKLNKQYALSALLHLKANPMLSKNELWSLVSDKVENEQMDVVKALFTNGYIVNNAI